MSSISGSDANPRSADTEALRRTRDESEKRESELVKKQAREVRHLNEAHYGEVERIKKDHGAQMENLHETTHEEISARDHKHLKEIEDIRNLARKEVKRVANDNSRREAVLKETNESESGGGEKHMQERLDKLSKDYEAKTRALGEHFDDAMAESRDIQSESIDKMRSKLNKVHEEEVADMRHERDAKIGALTNQYTKYRGQVNQERLDGERKHLQEARRGSDDLLHAVNKERVAAQENEDQIREGFVTNLRETREKLGQAREGDREAAQESQRTLKSTAMDRIDNQVRRLQKENQELKDGQVTAAVRNKGSNQNEIRNIRDSYQKNVDNYREQRDEAVKRGNQDGARDIAKVRDELNSEISEHDRASMEHNGEQSRIFRTAYKNLKDNFENRADQTQNMSEGRVKHIMDQANEEKARITQQVTENHTNSQRLKQEEMKSLREALNDDKNQAIGRVRDQMTKLETQHAEKVNMIVGKYEKQVQALKDELVKTRKSGEDGTKRLTEEMARMHKLELDQLDAKNRTKVRELSAQHSEELRTVNKRNEEKLDQVIGEMKRS